MQSTQVGKREEGKKVLGDSVSRGEHLTLPLSMDCISFWDYQNNRCYFLVRQRRDACLMSPAE